MWRSEVAMEASEDMAQKVLQHEAVMHAVPPGEGLRQGRAFAAHPPSGQLSQLVGVPVPAISTVSIARADT
jgi:hypothetical protein